MQYALFPNIFSYVYYTRVPLMNLPLHVLMLWSSVCMLLTLAKKRDRGKIRENHNNLNLLCLKILTFWAVLVRFRLNAYRCASPKVHSFGFTRRHWIKVEHFHYMKQLLLMLAFKVWMRKVCDVTEIEQSKTQLCDLSWDCETHHLGLLQDLRTFTDP